MWKWVLRRKVTAAAFLVLFVGLVAVGTYVSVFGRYGLIVLARGVLYWSDTFIDDPRLSPSMRLALAHPDAPVSADPPVWQTPADGFDVAEMPVMSEQHEVDRLYLVRIDPKRFRFVVRNEPAGNVRPEQWLDRLGAVFVVNGSYFGKDGTPDTPLKSDGTLIGPATYSATHGVFLESADFTGIRDLSNADWRDLVKGARDAMVSYPLLVSPDGLDRVKGNPQWLASRSFVGQDAAGRIIIGSTKDAFFSLPRLAGFLRTKHFDFKIALNLDGGPIVCQSVRLPTFRRDMCGSDELQSENGHLKLLQPIYGSMKAGLPVVLAALPR